jgi:hypothetical protein
VGVGYGREAEDDGDDRDYPLVCDPDGLEHGPDEVRDGGLADPAEGQGRYRDSDLADGEIGVQIAQRLAYDRGPPAAFLF